MQCSQIGSKLVHAGEIQCVVCQQRVDALLLIELAHFYRIFDDLAGAVEARLRRRAADRHHVEIELRREALIETQLFVAEVAALFQRGKIQKAKTHRLFDFVRDLAREQNPGDMRFEHAESTHRVRIKLRVLQGLNELGIHGDLRWVSGQYRVAVLIAAVRGFTHNSCAHEPRRRTRMTLYQVDKLMSEARRIAAEYRKATGKVLGISSEIARHDAARLMNLELTDDQNAGWDAIGHGPREGKRIQIKGRAIFDEQKGGQRVGQLKTEQAWDSVMVVMMDENYEPTEIYEADRADVAEAINESDSKRAKRGAMSLAKFKIISRLVWMREDGVVEDEIWDNQVGGVGHE